MKINGKEILKKIVADKALINAHLAKGGSLSELKHIKFVAPLPYPEKDPI